ncbi:DUF4439 domain-containing protein [Pseudarthrobacter sp. NamB4]|uniref:DUF4439 domain-containing protein n=1 Tax=Pseudarthrobacter sp. NamB4 TaxID=2576837 RepID=UPI001F0F8AE2|nr:DUF4439 domain-containing protein [Pseudarthrobacter sp. NamB4]
MKADNPENRPALRYFRYAVLAFTALLVLSLGFGLIPAAPPPAAVPPFPEQARAAALQETLRLRAAAVHLATPAAGAPVNPAVLDATVTLLTLQARALLSPSDSLPTARPTAPGSSPAAEATAADSSPSGPLSQQEPGPPAATTAAPAHVPTPGELASALSASGVQRLTDAEKAHGGMARLLAGTGTAQLLAAETMAASVGVPGDPLPHARPGTATAMRETSAPPADAAGTGPTPTSCPSPRPGPAGTESAGEEAGQETSTAGTPAGLGSALSMAVAVEQRSVYAYQAALPRLAPADAATAAAFLDQHQELAAEASAHSSAACSDPGAQQPGYVLGAEFLAAPAAGLAKLELAALPAYGDVVSQADGGLRKWAISALEETARRVARWGGDPGPVPGILLDAGQLPELPEQAESLMPAVTRAGN